MRLARQALTFMLFVGPSACQTSHDTEQHVAKGFSGAAEKGGPRGPVGPIPASECPVKDGVCTKEYSPVLCSASVYAGQAVKPNDRLVVWGANPCVGLLKLRQEACGNTMQPTLLSQIQCVPDASGEHCPPAQPQCSPQVKPSTCTAHAYGEAALEPAQRIRASETNECLARAKLKAEACRVNLDPMLLKKIFCEGRSKIKK